jgi:hypothetical protein
MSPGLDPLPEEISNFEFRISNFSDPFDELLIGLTSAIQNSKFKIENSASGLSDGG